MKKYYKAISWSSYDLPKVLQQRGVHEPEKLPGFHYRDDALRLWHAIKEYVSRILSIYYQSDEDIQKVRQIEKCAFITWGSSARDPQKCDGINKVGSLDVQIRK